MTATSWKIWLNVFSSQLMFLFQSMRLHTKPLKIIIKGAEWGTNEEDLSENNKRNLGVTAWTTFTYYCYIYSSKFISRFKICAYAASWAQQLMCRLSVNTDPLYRLCPSLGQRYWQKFLLLGICTTLGLVDACGFFASSGK